MLLRSELPKAGPMNDRSRTAGLIALVVWVAAGALLHPAYDYGVPLGVVLGISALAAVGAFRLAGRVRRK